MRRVRAGAIMGVWFLVLTGCQCVRAPDLRYACAQDVDCVAPERCLEQRCAILPDTEADGGVDAGLPDAGAPDAGAPDAGPVDAGSDAGLADAGSDAGCLAAEVACGDGLDDDCDNELDCADGDCRGQVCRPSTAACDVAERCGGGTCPSDGWKAVNDLCDDALPCTTDSRCLVDAGCGAGTPGQVVLHCYSDLGLRNLVPGMCPNGQCGIDGGEVLFRELPDGVSPLIPIFSVAIDAGAGSCTPDVCSDWRLSLTAPAGYCPANSLVAKVSLTPDAGLIAVYQYRSLAGQSSYGVSATPPAGSSLEPAGPIFWACPP